MLTLKTTIFLVVIGVLLGVCIGLYQEYDAARRGLDRVLKQMEDQEQINVALFNALTKAEDQLSRCLSEKEGKHFLDNR